MKYKPKSFIFDVDVYDARINILYLLTDEEVQQFLADNFPGLVYNRSKTDCAHSLAMDCKGYTEYLIDFILPFKTLPTLMGTIAHEVTHIKNYICEDRGIFLDQKNQEPEAYLVGCLIHKIVEGITK